jgi:hypothetical protein
LRVIGTDLSEDWSHVERVYIGYLREKECKMKTRRTEAANIKLIET